MQPAMTAREQACPVTHLYPDHQHGPHDVYGGAPEPWRCPGNPPAEDGGDPRREQTPCWGAFDAVTPHEAHAYEQRWCPGFGVGQEHAIPTDTCALTADERAAAHRYAEMIGRDVADRPKRARPLPPWCGVGQDHPAHEVLDELHGMHECAGRGPAAPTVREQATSQEWEQQAGRILSLRNDGKGPGREQTPEGFVPCNIDQQPQRQDDLRSQMATVLDAARRLGCYDAMDWLYLTYFDKDFTGD